MRSHRTRATAQKTLNAIWVTDDVLAEALTRFSLVSQAHRRHGSHVPGPLEAQRRLAKRRMGIAAMGTTGPASTGMDWWAGLFGLGGGGAPIDYEKSWKWEPPLIRDLPFMKTNCELALATSMGQIDPPAAVEAETMTVTDNVALREPVDVIETSKAEFQNLLDIAQGSNTVESITMDRFLDFLRSSANESLAMNTATLVKWLNGRMVSSLAIEKLDEAIIEKINLETISEREIRHILVAWTRQEVENYEARVLSVFQNLGISRMTDVIDWTTLSLFPKSSTRRGRIINHDRVEKWLNAVHAFYASKIPDFDHPLWRRMYGNVFRFTNPEHIVGHLRRLEWSDLAMILLRSRTPFLEHSQVNAFTYTKNAYLRMPDKRAASDERAPVKVQVDTTKLDTLLDRYKFLRRFRQESAKANNEEILAGHGIQAMIDSLVILKDEGLPYQLMCEDMFAIVNMTRAAKTLDEFWKCIRKHKELDVTEKIVLTMIDRFRKEGIRSRTFVLRAAEIFRQYPSLYLSQFPELPLKLIDFGKGQPSNIFPLLHRRRIGHPLPDQHIEIVHLVAYKWAHAKNLTNRQAFTRVWECYRFLQDRQIPARPLMSRAIVQAGVTRYLMSGQRVPIEQAKYVCTIVKQCEGPKAAQALDQILWRIWNGDLTGYRGHSQIQNWISGVDKNQANDSVREVRKGPRFKAWGKKRVGMHLERVRQDYSTMRAIMEERKRQGHLNVKELDKETAAQDAMKWLETSQPRDNIADEANREQ
ncbi:Hypothetical protein R9X50_00701500 [Acrodontium crateriforme]|uniref:Uncharacterized protein n=1 Tax=Acrodontium crateriforme TaxID=150365 RepID=A0AAQ3MAP8_9PEZI|nr:Hypothetical protein R9X50_00701500 [Acrodontium crateriforme]